jgi:hypothetical protein
MKVQTKITLLLLAVVAFFMGALWACKIYDGRKFARITEEREIERKQSFQAFLKKDGEPLQTLTDYDTTWDQMVQAIQKKATPWFEDNVNKDTLVGYKANAVWIYDRNGALVYSKDSRGETPPPLRVPPGGFGRLFANDSSAHFFIKLKQDQNEPKEDLFEIRAATVHGSMDSGRQTPPQGFFFAGRLWNEAAVDEMSLFANNQIRLVMPPAEPVPEKPTSEQDGVVTFSQMLTDWDGKPVAQLVVRNESPVVRELNRASEWLRFAFLIFALVVLLLISCSLFRWVSRPRRLIIWCLNR